MTELEYKVARIKLALEYEFKIKIYYNYVDNSIYFFRNSSFKSVDGGILNNVVCVLRETLEDTKIEDLIIIEKLLIKEFANNAIQIYSQLMRNEAYNLKAVKDNGQN